MSPASKNRYLAVLILLAVAVALGTFLAFGPPGLYARSETPEFCGSCHVLETEYEAWFHGGAHSRIKCVDCHLPNDNFPNHLLWKTLDGVKDALKFHTGRVSDPITLSSHGARVVKENCQRCHAETVARVNEDRQCWTCHRRLSHKQVGAIATWTPSTP